MTGYSSDLSAGLLTLPPLPGWIGTGLSETEDGMAFQSGAVLTHLHLLQGFPALPCALWRERLALAAAEQCVRLSGRSEGARALRDALHLAKAGDDPGPAGAVLRAWSQAVARPISVAHLGRALPDVGVERIALCLGATGGTPVDRAARVIESVLADAPRAEMAALILAEAALSAALGWDHLLPLLALGLTAREMRLRDQALRQACHRAVVAAAGQAVPMAADLARRAGRLAQVAPKLRAKGAGRAVALFLTRDALAPAALAKDMQAGLSDRAARRLCERLVDLGALRELTGRDAFRLYGL